MTHDDGSRYSRCLVTGGAGFIGSHLTDALLERGRQVTVLDDLSTGKRANLSGDRAGLRVVVGTVLDASTVDPLVEEADVVYHLAAAVGVKHIVSDPLRSLLINVRGTEIVLDAAHRHRRRILLASTSEVYGKSTDVPFREDGERVLGSTTVHRWSYSTAKALDEHMAFAYADRGLEVSVVRYFNSYGPRIDQRGYGSVIARFAGQALLAEPLTVHGDGSQTRCFTYVTDTVRGTILAAETDRARGTVVNIGSQHELSIAELAERVNAHFGGRSTIVRVPHATYYGPGFEDTRRRIPDTARARDMLGFEARVAIAKGLRTTLEWCRANFSDTIAS